MARTHSRTKTTIWDADGEFTLLSSGAQRVYWLLYSQKTVSLAGILAYTPTRWSQMASDTPVEGIILALGELEEQNYIVTDPLTEELLIRSFMRNDGVRPGNSTVWKSAMTSIEAVLSKRIKAAVEAEVDRILALDDGSEVPRDSVSNGAFVASSYGASDAASNAPPDGASSKQRGKGIGVRGKGIDDLFSEFWKIYPRRASKRAAQTAFGKALERVDVQVVLAGALDYRNDSNREDEYTKYPATWLNNDCWDDDPIPERRKKRGNEDRITDFANRLKAVHNAAEDAANRSHISRLEAP